MDKAAAYYNYAMGHLYAELAGAYGNRSEYLNKAIDHFRAAMKADPGAAVLSEELSDLYVQAGRLREAVLDAEEALRQNPNDLNARRILGRIYMRLIGDSRQGRVDENMLKRAIEQYQKISEALPGDLETWLTLGRLHKVAQDSVAAEQAFQKALSLDGGNEDALTGLALVYSDLGDARRATELLEKIAGKNPSLRTLTSLAQSYEQMRDYASAAATLQKTLEMAPDNPDIKRALAQNLMLADRIDDARKLFEELAAEDPKDVVSLLRISQIYRQQGNFPKAREAADKARQLDPGSLEVLYNDVNLLELEGKTDEAIGTLRGILASTSKKDYSASERANRAILLERLGLLYRSNDQTEDAVRTFREMAVLDADLAGRAAAQVVDTYRQARQYDKALAEADTAYQQFPKDRTLIVVRSSLLADLGRGQEAVAEVKKLFNGSGDRENWLTLAQTLERAKDFESMGKAIDEAEKLSVTSEEKELILFLRGAMYEKMKKSEESEAQFRKLLELNPKSASALNYLGYMLADRNVRINEAYEMIRKAVDMEPNNGAYLDSLGWVYFRMGKLDEAADYLLRALDQAGKDPTVRDHLGDVYFQQGKLKEAITQWETSLQLWKTSPPSEQDPAESAKIQKKLEGARVRLAKESKN